MNNEIAVREGATPAPYDPEFARLAAQRETIKAQIMPEGSTEAELDVFMATCAAQGLDPFMGQIIAIRPDAKKDKDGKPTGPVKPFRTWEGLVAIAERTGDYGGRVGPFWTGDGKEWLEVWLDEENPPQAAKVGIKKRSVPGVFAWGVATLAAWGTQDEYVDETDANGRKVIRKGKFGDYTARVKTGRRTLKPSWWQMPQTPHQLAKIAFVIGLKSSFQPQMLRRATQAIDSEVVDGAMPASRDQIIRAHAATPESLQGKDNRVDRLQVASMFLRRPITSYNDLTSDEASQLADWFDAVGEDYEEIVDYEVVDEDTQAEPDPGPAAPVSPASPSAASGAEVHEGSAGTGTLPSREDSARAPASVSAVQSSAGEEQLRTGSAASSGPSPKHSVASAGHHPQGSAGGGHASVQGGWATPNPVPSPAEHHSEPSGGQAATPQVGTASGAGVGKPQPSGGASGPTRKRPKPGKPNLLEAAQEASRERNQRVVEHLPSRWIHTLPVDWRNRLLEASANWMQPHAHVDDVMRRIGPGFGKSLEAWTDDMEWTDDQLDRLLAEVLESTS